MKKSDSLIKLDSLGMNTIDYFITKDKKEATHYLAKHITGRRSMRTERGDEFLCPFYYWYPSEDLLPKALKHIDEGYKLIFSDSLDWKESVAFGSVALTKELNDHIDLVFGPGLCRDLEAHPKRISIAIPIGTITPFKEVVLENNDINQIRLLNTIYKLVKDKCLDLAPCVVEFSRYPYPVGKMKKHFIFWELRSY